MSIIKASVYILTFMLQLLLSSNICSAATQMSTATMNAVNGRIEQYSLRYNSIIINDTTYYLSPDVVITTAKGRKGQRWMLHRGTRVHMETAITDNKNTEKVYKIDIVN